MMKDGNSDSAETASIKELSREIRKLNERLDTYDPKLKKVEENEEMVEEIYDFIFNEEGIEGRSVVDDLMLLRNLYNNVSGFSAIIGFVIGVFTIVIPVAVGLFQLYGYIIKWVFN